MSETNLVTPKKTMTAEDFKKMEGTSYGGEMLILDIKVGQAVELTYRGSKVMTTDFGEATSHIGEDADGKVLNLPLSKIFVKNFELAGIKRGDKFALLRVPDVKGKKGISKGKIMQNFEIKVTELSPV